MWIFGFIAAFLLISPYAKGLFTSVTFNFEQKTNLFFLFGSLIAFFSAVIIFVNFKRNNHHWIYYAVWLLPISFIFPSFTALSQHSAIKSIFLYTIYASFFIVGAYLVRSLEKWLTLTLLISGYAITIFGLLHWFGWSYYQDAVNQGRISSVFQYANTYAIFLLCVAMGSIYLIITNSQKSIITYLASFMLIPTMVSFFLTGSRGALIVIPLIVLLVLVVLSFRTQILFLYYFLTVTIVTLIFYSKLESLGHQVQQSFSYSKSLWGWMLLALIALLVVGFVWLSQRYVHPFIENKTSKLQSYKWSRSFIPLLMLIVIAAALIVVFYVPSLLFFLPDNLQNRLSSINMEQRSVVERLAFYRDGFKVFMDYPIFGAGGGAWSSSFQAYQSEPYTSREAHSYYIQILSETGIVGIALLLFVMAFVVIRYVKWTQHNNEGTPSLIFYIFASAILVHSFLDFNMSFAYIASIVFLSLGVLFGKVPLTSFPSPSMNFKYVKQLNYAAFGSMLVVTIILLIFSIRFIQGNMAYDKVTKELASGNANYPVIMNHLDTALSNQSDYSEYRLMEAQVITSVYQQTHEENYYSLAIKNLNRTLELEPYNSRVYSLRILLEKLKGDAKSALQFTDQAIALFPWSIEFCNEGISAAYQLYNASTSDTDKKIYETKIKSYQKIVLDKQQRISELPTEQASFIHYNFTPEVESILNKIAVN